MNMRRSRDLRCACGFVFDLLDSLLSRTGGQYSSVPSIRVSNPVQGPVQLSGNASSCKVPVSLVRRMR